MDEFVYDSISRENIIRLTENYLTNNSDNNFCEIDKEISNTLNILNEMRESEKYEIQWFNTNICYNIFCLKYTIFEKYLDNIIKSDLNILKSELNFNSISFTSSNFETNNNIDDIFYYCIDNKECFYSFINENENFVFFKKYADYYDLDQYEIEDILPYMNAYFDVKLCCDVIYLNLVKDLIQ